MIRSARARPRARPDVGAGIEHSDAHEGGGGDAERSRVQASAAGAPGRSGASRGTPTRSSRRRRRRSRRRRPEAECRVSASPTPAATGNRRAARLPGDDAMPTSARRMPSHCALPVTAADEVDRQRHERGRCRDRRDDAHRPDGHPAVEAGQADQRREAPPRRKEQLAAPGTAPPASADPDVDDARPINWDHEHRQHRDPP